MTLEERADALGSASARLREAQRLIEQALCNLIGEPVSEARTALEARKATRALDDAKQYLARLI